TITTAGPHTLYVNATDNNPNANQNTKIVSTPVTVDLSKPTVKITGAFDGKGNKLGNGTKTTTNGAKFYITGTDNNPGIVIKCQIDSASPTNPAIVNGVATCSYTNLTTSIKHTFKAWSIDAAGNTSPTISWTWMINPPVQKK